MIQRPPRSTLFPTRRSSDLTWAYEQGRQVLFLPDQHLGRNTAVLELGFSLDDCVLYDPHRPHGGLRSEEHTSELQSRQYLVCRLLLEKKNTQLRPAPVSFLS